MQFDTGGCFLFANGITFVFWCVKFHLPHLRLESCSCCRSPFICGWQFYSYIFFYIGWCNLQKSLALSSIFYDITSIYMKKIIDALVTTDVIHPTLDFSPQTLTCCAWFCKNVRILSKVLLFIKPDLGKQEVYSSARTRYELESYVAYLNTTKNRYRNYYNAFKKREKNRCELCFSLQYFNNFFWPSQSLSSRCRHNIIHYAYNYIITIINITI